MVDLRTKICSRCKKEFSIDNFYKNKSKKDGHNCYCKDCANKSKDKWSINNKEKERNTAKVWRKKNKEKLRKQKRKETLKKIYGITLNDYNEMFSNQSGCCAICGKHQSQENKALSVDHNHLTGEVRKLLCCKCNFLVGKIESNIDIIDNIFSYLEENNGKEGSEREKRTRAKRKWKAVVELK